MQRIIIILSILATSMPAIGRGADDHVSFFDVWPAEQPDWLMMPSSDASVVSSAAVIPDLQIERPDWFNFGRPDGWIDSQDLVVRAQNADGQSGGGGEDLTAQANDPTASLISFNVQNFFTTSSYEATGHGYSLGLLPVIPIQQEVLGFDRIITRPSIPIFGPSVDPFGPVDSASGLGDIFMTNLFIKEASWGTWGVGPSVNFPSATDPALGSREWQIAPSAVVVMSSADKKWLYGGLVIAPFSLESSAKSISFQPILVRFLPDDWYVGNGFQVWNWQTSNGNFSMPLTLRVGRVFKELKPYPLNISMQAGYTPDAFHQGPAAQWQFLFNVTVLIPAG